MEDTTALQSATPIFTEQINSTQQPNIIQDAGNSTGLCFLGGPLEGVNRFADHKSSEGIACRCVKG